MNAYQRAKYPLGSLILGQSMEAGPKSNRYRQKLSNYENPASAAF